MTTNDTDARERAWEEWWDLVVGDDEPGEDTHDPHFNFNGGYNAAKREDEQRIAALVAALDEARVKFQNETLRTSELITLLLRFEKLHKDRGHEPGAWSRTCIDCELVAAARALVAKPVNVRANCECGEQPFARCLGCGRDLHGHGAEDCVYPHHEFKAAS